METQRHRTDLQTQSGKETVDEWRGSSVLQNTFKGMASLWKGCVNLFYSKMGRDKLSLYKLNKI